MIKGKTEAETLRLNGWKVGDILEGDEGRGPDRILITAIGEDKFTCKWDYRATGAFDRESGNTTLSCRNWKKVGFHVFAGSDNTMTPEEAELPADEHQGKYSAYHKDVRHLKTIDVYRTVDLFGCEAHGHAISHAAKKLLLTGSRTGGKSVEQDVSEAIDSLQRWLEMREEDRLARELEQ